MRTLAAALLLTAAIAAQPRWTELGPAPVSNFTGRVAAVAASATNANRYYVGGADGGVWRTDDAGATWTPLTDFQPSTAVGALELDPANDLVLYVGTGEANFANHSRYGVGVLKTVDGGQSFTLLGASTFAGRCFARLRLAPGSSQVLYAAITTAGGFPAVSAARQHPQANGPLGIFKSSDGGQSWTHLTNGLPTNVSATDVTLDPVNPQIVYAAFGHVFGHPSNGVYKSIDGGQSFAKLAGGLPATTVGRITLAVAPSQGQRLYASYVNPCDAQGNSGSALNVFRSDDGGAAWAPINPGSYQATYGWYLCTSLVGRTDPNLFFAGGFSLVRTTVGGGSWQTVTPPHVDLHALAWDAAGRLLCGNDGGLHRSVDNGGSWTSLNLGLGLVQFYAGFALAPGATTTMLGGMQDNGSGVRNGPKSWTQVLGGDGGCAAIDSTGTRFFAEYQGVGTLFRSLNGGSYQGAGSGITGRTCFLAPYEIHPLDPMRMVYGAERVFLSTNGGTSWAPISPDLTGGGIAAIRGIAQAPSSTQTIYVSTNDGRLQVTENAGQSWQLRRSGVPGWFRTTHPFAIHPSDPKRCWFAVGAFGTNQVLSTADAGANWLAADGNLPDVPAHCLDLDSREGDPMILYLGTDQGVWRSVDLGVSWVRYGVNLPNAPVIDLRVDAKNSRLVAATQGRGAWQITLVPRAWRLGWGKSQ